VIIEFTIFHAFFFAGDAVGYGLDMLLSINPSLFFDIKAIVIALFQSS